MSKRQVHGEQDRQDRADLDNSVLEVLVFDDGKGFEYLHGIENEMVKFIRCKTFEELEEVLFGMREGQRRLPGAYCLDLFCEQYRDFSLLGRADISVIPGSCGVQIFKEILPQFDSKLSGKPVLFFSSYPEEVSNLPAAALRRLHRAEIRVCKRVEFRTQFIKLLYSSNVRSRDFLDSFLPRELDQSEYSRLFCTIADRIDIRPAERRTFLGLLSEETTIDAFFSIASTANERVDILLEIAMLLDEFIADGDQRSYLHGILLDDEGGTGFSKLLRGSVSDLLAVKQELEYFAGGELL